MKIYQNIAKGKLLMRKNAISKECHELILGLLERDPEKRFDIPKIKNHKFFKGMSW